MCGWCGEGWRFEATQLGGPNAGQVKAILHPLSAQWENAYSQPSDGSMVVATQDPSQEDIWAGATGLYISQVMPDGTRRARFGGYIPKFNGAGGGATTVAFHSIDKFLEKRLLAGPNDPWTMSIIINELGEWIGGVEKPASTTPGTVTSVYNFYFPNGSNAELAALLVDIARGNLEGEGFTGIPTLTAVTEPPTTVSVIPGADGFYTYNWWEFKNIGQMVRELVEAETGIKYRLEHTYTDGYWSTQMVFSDVIGAERDYTILSDREAWQYGLEVDAEEKATRVYGVGSGEEWYTQFSIAYDADTDDNLPEHQVTVAWKDQTDAVILDGLTRGYVTDHRDPTTVPSVTLIGLPDYDPDAPDYNPQKGFPGPEILEPGDMFDVDIGYGVITVKDIRVRALAIAWNLEQGMTAQRTLAMQPIIRANTSVRTQTPAKSVNAYQPVTEVVPAVPTSNPWPTPGLVSRVTGGTLTEISGMQASFKNLGHVWVFNDEKENPQVRLVKTSTGVPVGSYNVTGVSPAPWGDPEAIRLARSTGKLVLADIGDNSNNRPTSGVNQPSLLVVTEPKGGGAKGTLPTTRLPISYPNGLQVNAETLLINPVNEQVHIITKEPTQARVYSFGTLSAMNTTDNEGVLVATLGVSMVSDGTHTWAGDFVLLRTAKVSHTVVYDHSPAWKKVGDIPTPAMTKSEAITAESTCAFLTTTETKGTGDEANGAPIYRVLIPKAYGASCNTVAGPVDSGTGGEGPNGPKVVPGQVIDMKQWKLQLPI